MRSLLLALFVVLPSVAGAQSVPSWADPVAPDAMGAPSSPPPPPPSIVAQQVPIDGGLGLLALAGGAYAVRRLRRRG